MVTRSLPSAFSVVIQHMLANEVEQGYDRMGWLPIEKIDLMHFKEVMISYGMHSLMERNS